MKTNQGTILILGGTTEGRKAIKVLDAGGSPFYYSTKEGEMEIAMHHGNVIRGAMTAEVMSKWCREHDVRLLVDAAHPFAAVLHETVRTVSEELAIPVIRFERIFTQPSSGSVVWINDYSEALKEIHQDKIKRLLVLTGVQSTVSLYPVLRDMSVDAYFRILNRESSLSKARLVGVPSDRILFLEEGGDDAKVFADINPDAILLKDSGVTGQFAKKVDIATSMGIKVYALRRPGLPESFIKVDGPHGLRREVERLLPDFFPLHTGITTGTCATAASIGDVLRLTGMVSPGVRKVGVRLPDSETLNVEVEVGEANTSVKKHAGSDPDVTDGITLSAAAEVISGQPGIIEIEGGDGIGRVTLPGLGIKVGEAAINSVPRMMIEENVRPLAKDLLIRSGIRIVISAQGGEEIARRTFNPRLGITGGISIIGTSGIVQPFSSDAFVDSIRKSVSVALATGCDILILNSGARSERAMKKIQPDIPEQSYIHYGNFIGKTLAICREQGVGKIVMGVMIGKAVKLARGHLNTHSHSVTMDRDFISDILRDLKVGGKTFDRMKDLNLARELYEMLGEEELRIFSGGLLKLCYAVCKPIVPDSFLRLYLISDELEIISDYTEK